MIEEPKWRAKRGLGAKLKRAAELARTRGGNARGTLTILLASDARLKALNTTFRGKDKATNVLSFPARRGDYLGDVAIAYGVTDKEARASRKSFADHATHLAVHGVLHLLGYDHETARAARVMEPLETAILSELGVDDPYAGKAA
jgi:probable rRNA maturation factor